MTLDQDQRIKLKIYLEGIGVGIVIGIIVCFIGLVVEKCG